MSHNTQALALHYPLKVTQAAGLSTYGIPVSVQTRFISRRGSFPIVWTSPGTCQKLGPSWYKTSAVTAQAKADQHHLDANPMIQEVAAICMKPPKCTLHRCSRAGKNTHWFSTWSELSATASRVTAKEGRPQYNSITMAGTTAGCNSGKENSFRFLQWLNARFPQDCLIAHLIHPDNLQLNSMINSSTYIHNHQDKSSVSTAN